MAAKLSKAEALCLKLKDHILDGIMISCDPSSSGGGGKQHSDPAFTHWKAGEWQETWREQAKGSWSPVERLTAISKATQATSKAITCDVLIVEDVGVIRGKFNTVNKPLIWSVGAIAGGLAPKYMIEIMPNTWKRFVDMDTYIKSDVNDSIALGWAAMQMAKGAKDKLPLNYLMED